MKNLRMRFVEQCKQYFGVPYAKKYQEPGSKNLLLIQSVNWLMMSYSSLTLPLPPKSVLCQIFGFMTALFNITERVYKEWGFKIEVNQLCFQKLIFLMRYLHHFVTVEGQAWLLFCCFSWQETFLPSYSWAIMVCCTCSHVGSKLPDLA